MKKTYRMHMIDAYGDCNERYDFSDDVKGIRIIEITSKADVVDITIERNTGHECEAELNGQISDGFFENYRINLVVPVNM